MIGSRLIPACPYNLTPGTLYVPFSAPTGLRAGTYPASTITHHCSTIEGNRGCCGRRIDELAPGRVPGLTGDLRWLLTENHTHQVEMVDGHIHEQGLPYLVIGMAFHCRGIAVASEVDTDRTNRSQFPLANQGRNGSNSRKETIILADHKHAVLLCSRFDHRSEERRVGEEGRSRWSAYH